MKDQIHKVCSGASICIVYCTVLPHNWCQYEPVKTVLDEPGFLQLADVEEEFWLSVQKLTEYHHAVKALEVNVMST